jgi:hypothetical protein
MSNAEGYVLPKPGIPKTLGILNVIFGVLLVLVGLCLIGFSLLGPMFVQIAEDQNKQIKARIEVEDKATQKAFDDRVTAAKTDEEKKAIEQERAATPATPRIQTVDLSAAKDAMNDPTIKAVGYAGIISGLILHVALLISGIGLIRLRPWGRSLALWWGGLQILQTVVFLVISIVVVNPVTRPIQEKQIAKMEEAAKAPGANPALGASLQMTKFMASMEVPLDVLKSLAAMIYPVVLLIMLNGAAARAALLVGRKPEGLSDH